MSDAEPIEVASTVAGTTADPEGIEPQPGTAVEPAPPPLPDVPLAEAPTFPSAVEFRDLAAMAVTISAAMTTCPADLRGKPNDVFLVLLTARDLGIKITDALRTVFVVKGHVTLAPRLKLALVARQGLGRIWPDPGNDARQATAHAIVRATGETFSYTVTMEDAERAGLVKSGGAWESWPQRMLWWRAAGFLVDDLFPEAAMGIYSPDEMGGAVDEEGEPIDVASVEVPRGMNVPPGTKRPEPPLPEGWASRTDFEAAFLGSKRRVQALAENRRVMIRQWWTAKEMAWPLTLEQYEDYEALIVAHEGAEAKDQAEATHDRAEQIAAEAGIIRGCPLPAPHDDHDCQAMAQAAVEGWEEGERRRASDPQPEGEPQPDPRPEDATPLATSPDTEAILAEEAANGGGPVTDVANELQDRVERQRERMAAREAARTQPAQGTLGGEDG